MTTNDLPKDYAGFWVRVGAALIDGLILIIPILMAANALPVLGGVLVGFLYKPIFEASRAKATPGKRAMGLQVIPASGDGRIGPRAALVRYLISGISGIVGCLGHLVMLFTQKRQTLHDLVADTVVVYGRNEESLADAWIDEIRSWFNGGFSRP